MLLHNNAGIVVGVELRQQDLVIGLDDEQQLDKDA